MSQPDILTLFRNLIDMIIQQEIMKYYRKIQNENNIENNSRIDLVPSLAPSENQISDDNYIHQQSQEYPYSIKQQQPLQSKSLYDREYEFQFQFSSDQILYLNYIQEQSQNPNSLQQKPERNEKKNNKVVETQQWSTTPINLQNNKDNKNQISQSPCKECLRKRLKVKKLKNQQLLKFDDTFKVYCDLDNFLQQQQQHNQISQIIMNIENLKKQVDSQNYDEKDTTQIEKNFKQFANKKFYNLENFNHEVFQTNSFNIIASQLILKNKITCTKKLKECYIQLSKNWINLLDFTKIKKKKKYLDKLRNVKGFLKNEKNPKILENNPNILKNINYFLNKNYEKYSFLEIALNLLQILQIYQDYDKIKQDIFENNDNIKQDMLLNYDVFENNDNIKQDMLLNYDVFENNDNIKQDMFQNYDKIKQDIFELLEGVVKMKLEKYKSKRAINFTKQNIIDLMYKNDNDNVVIDEEAFMEIKQLLEEDISYPQGLKKKKS